MLPVAHNMLFKVTKWVMDSNEDTGSMDGLEEVESLDDADIVVSKLRVGGMHRIMLDIDVPAQLIESSTPGHSHLYINCLTTWDRYSALLDALAEAGVVETGYVAASKKRGFTSLRLPWVTKRRVAQTGASGRI